MNARRVITMLLVSFLTISSEELTDDQSGESPDAQKDLNPQETEQTDIKWMVQENCLALSMAAELTVFPNNSFIFQTTNVPASATVSNTSSCSVKSSGSTQVITLDWRDRDLVTGVLLVRNISISFNIDKTSPIPMYGISMVTAMYEITENQGPHGNNSISSYNTIVKGNTTNQFIEMSTGLLSPMLYPIPLYSSFVCDNALTLDMTSHLLSTGGSHHLQELKNSSIILNRIQFNAFRPNSVPVSEFQASISCTMSNPSDLVPIVVGGGLAGIVLFIVICYVLGRRKKTVKVKGYSSV